MRVAGAGDIFRRGLELHGQAELADHLADIGPDQVGPEDFIRLGIGQDFNKPVRGMIGARAGIGLEGEFALLVFAAFGLELVFRLTDRGDFRCRVDHARNDAVIHMASLARNAFGAGHAFILGLVGEHRAMSAITDDPDILRRGAEMIIGDETALVGLDAHGLQAQTLGVGAAPDAHDDRVGVQRLAFAALGRLDRDFQRLAGRIHAGYLGGQVEIHALFGKNALGRLGQFAVHARQDAVEILDHGHFGTQAAPDRAEFQPDHAGADHDQLARHFLQRQGAC